MSDFKAKMHQNRFRLGLSQTLLGELTALPRLLAVFTSKGKKGEGEERREREAEGKRKEGRGRTTLHTPVANSWLRHWSRQQI